MSREGEELTNEDIINTYEVSKMTNTTKQILDEFTSSITMLMFSDYLKSFDDPQEALHSILNNWEKQVITLKEVEIDTLINQTDSMTDVTIGSVLAEGTDLKNYIDSVGKIKGAISDSISREI